MSDSITWTCIYKTAKRFEAEAIRGNLESSDIPCVILNKQDSSYLAFGLIEIHVPENKRKAAELILSDHIHQN